MLPSSEASLKISICTPRNSHRTHTHFYSPHPTHQRNTDWWELLLFQASLFMNLPDTVTEHLLYDHSKMNGHIIHTKPLLNKLCIDRELSNILNECWIMKLKSGGLQAINRWKYNFRNHTRPSILFTDTFKQKYLDHCENEYPLEIWPEHKLPKGRGFFYPVDWHLRANQSSKYL